MSAYSSRKLRENPAGLIREVQSGGLPVITLRGQPVGIVVPFETALQGGARAGLAAALLAEQVVSLGTAARIAGCSVEEFVELTGRLGHRDVLSDVDRLDEDLRHVDELRR